MIFSTFGTGGVPGVLGAGAAISFGFAAFESAGDAFTALVSIIGIAWLLVLWRRTPRPVRIAGGVGAVLGVRQDGRP